MNRRAALLGGAAAALLGGAFAAAQGPRVIRVTARKFAFEPARIDLRRGETAVLELTSADRSHGFKLPALGLREDMLPGEVRRLALTPDRAGTFVFLCDIFCGDEHDDMAGEIVVTG